MRGMLTDEVQAKAVEFFGTEITTRELRLLPYLDYKIKNTKSLNRNLLSVAEAAIVDRWFKAGYLVGTYARFDVTKNFYNAMQELLWLAYVKEDLPDKMEEINLRECAWCGAWEEIDVGSHSGYGWFCIDCYELQGDE